ncbi:LLM class flavin-dependent oxidoreductase [Streptomyces sp. NBC_01217]|uniref:LLM class flavin-dependent oxidoreductase n=1 Tax=Streptomyces sp. NBC_01217 TaxID=2903779 RepID=UPI002E0D1D33|nr:LLM class flavin-dependent oxidoreductase [Streptomyces sp. NBC_01217]
MLGVQIAPWASAREVLSASAVLAKAFDVVWVPDQMLARNAHVLLSAVAATGNIGVASGITFPVSRNPIDMASAMATIGELVPPDRPVLMGVGAGGSLVSSLFSKRDATELLRQSVTLVRRLWAGEAVPLADFPLLTERLNARDGATARLTYPVTREIPVLVAVGGPRTLRLAHDVADGLLCTSTYPPLSYAALRSGDGAPVREISALAARRAREGRPLRLVYGLNCCVSADRGAARTFARRQAALAVGNPALRSKLADAGLDAESADAVRAAFEEGLGVEGAGRRLSDSLLDGLIVSGTPDDCVERLAQLIPVARSAGFEEFYLGAPLGPDIEEASRLLVGSVVPPLWPERA